jgi:hypothetical protein
VNNDGPPWRDYDMMDNGTSDDHSAACADAAGAMHSARADDGACVDGAQGDEASCQQ